MSHAWKGREITQKFLSRTPKDGNHLHDLSLDGKIMLKLALKE